MQNNLKTLATLTVGIITALVVIVGVFIPVMSGLEDNIVSTANNVTDRFMVADDSDNNVVVEYIEGTGFLINGETYTANSQLVIIADGFTAALTAQPIGVSDSQNQFIGLTNKVTFSGGTYTYSPASSSTVYTGTYDTLLYPDKDGDYGCFMGVYGESMPFTADKNDVVYAIQRSGTVRFVAEIQNGVKTGFLSSPFTYADSTYAAYTGTVTFNVTGENTEDSLGYDYTQITATYDGTTVTPNIYAPIFYHEIDANAEAARAIVGVLPLVLILGLIIMAGAVMMSAIRTRSEL